MENFIKLMYFLICKLYNYSIHELHIIFIQSGEASPADSFYGHKRPPEE